MKILLQQLASCNAWANALLLDTALGLAPEQHKQTVESSFPSLLQTVVHMLDAESVWWQRVKLQEKIEVPSAAFTGGLSEAALALKTQDRLWLEWVNNAPNHMFGHEFIYQNSKREQFKQPVYQVLLHVFSHSTYHRGQLVTMLRQLGVQKIPQTDFIVWSRKKGS